MMKKLFLALGIVAALTVGTNWSRASQIYGELQKALFEKLSSDPTGTEARFYWNTADKKAKIYDGTSWVNIGTGSSSGINYLSANPDAEANVTGWTTYADAAGTAPVDCTGGSPASTWTRTTSTPLRGTGSFLWTKSAANRQGEGVSIPFTLDAADQSKPLTISFDVTPDSGTYVTGDLTSYIYDVTNATVIQPAGYQIVSTTAGVPYKMVATFQASAASTSYRYCVHTASTSATAYTVKFDNFVVGPAPQTLGVPSSDWVDYTPTGTWVTNTTYTGKWRRVGDTMEIRAYAALSGAPTGSFTLRTPSQFTVDETKALLPTSGSYGEAFAYSGGSLYTGTVTYQGSSAINVIGNSTGNIWSATIPATFANTNYVHIHAFLPITGWSANVAMSSDTDTRVIAAKYTGNAGQSLTANVTDIPFATNVYDTSASWNGSQYTAPVPGVYSIKGMWLITTNSTPSTFLYVNGSASTQAGRTTTSDDTQNFYGEAKLNAGDTLSIRSNTSLTLSNSSTRHWLSIQRLSGPATVAASESIVAKVYLAANQSVANTSTNATILYDTIVKDSHGAFNTSTGIFTCPVSGQYLVAPSIRYVGAQTWVAGNYLDMGVYLGSTLKYARSFDVSTTAAAGQELQGDTLIACLAGETIKVQTSHNRTAGAINLFGSATQNTLSITRVGNY